MINICNLICCIVVVLKITPTTTTTHQHQHLICDFLSITLLFFCTYVPKLLFREMLEWLLYMWCIRVTLLGIVSSIHHHRIFIIKTSSTASQKPLKLHHQQEPKTKLNNNSTTHHSTTFTNQRLLGSSQKQNTKFSILFNYII